eukprot:TRINITY_DN4098_c0_g2_i3.p1 TRINITY_DN4098_c0_g2~~TRINITY_DN4098_c0_g2_i3.p1  ORF type:complete len:228 (+),score=42.98 TRINITY_DN4098_c0_g2_i3:528-1211(+)
MRASVGRRIVKRLIISLLWLLISFLLAAAVTSIIKVYDGRLRPDFFGMCNYKGYREALAMCEADLSTWRTCMRSHYNITIGMPGRFEHCRDQSMLHKSQSSYPSGHASTSMAGFGFLAWFLYHSFEGRTFLNVGVRLLAPPVLLLGALLIAASRPHDYWHNFSDVNFGMTIGISSMMFSGTMWKNQMVVETAHELDEDPVHDALGEEEEGVEGVEGAGKQLDHASNF